MKSVYSITALWLLVAAVSLHAADSMNAFLPAGGDMVRHVLQLPK